MKNKYVFIVFAHLISCSTFPADYTLGQNLPESTSFIISAFEEGPTQTDLQNQLTEACRLDDPARAYGLIRAGADPLQLHVNCENLAHIAARYNANRVLILLAKKTAVNFNAHSEEKETPLSIAIQENVGASNETVRVLLAKGACPDTKATSLRWTPLMIASRFNNAHVIQTLLSYKAQPHITAYTRNALSIAYLFNSTEAAELLLEQSISTQYHPLHYLFAPHGIFEHDDARKLMPMFNLLKNHAFNLNGQITINGKSQSLVAHLLERPGTFKALKSLLACGARAPAHAVGRLFNATVQTNKPEDREKLILCLSRSKQIYTTKGRSLLIEAAKLENPSFARAIAEACPHYHTNVDEYEGTALQYLVRIAEPNEDVHACIDLMSALINNANKRGVTPIMHTQNVSVAAHLIALGADIHAQDIGGTSALEYHISFPHPGMVSLLLYAGALQNPKCSIEKLRTSARRTHMLLTQMEDLPFAPANESVIAFLMSIEHALPKINAIIRILRHPERELHNPEYARYFQDRLNLTCSNMRQRETDPRSSKRARKS